MEVVGIVLFPVGMFLVLVGVIIAVDAPFMKQILDEIELLSKNRRVIGTVVALAGLVLIALSYLG